MAKIIDVSLREVATRDGFQSVDIFIPTDVKFEIINAIKRTGIKEIEVTSFVSSKFIPQLGDAEKLVSMLSDTAGVIYSALVPNLKGAYNGFKAGINRLIVFISASEAHNLKNVRKSIGKSLSELKKIFNFASNKEVEIVGSVAVAFGCPYQGEVNVKDVFRIVEAYLSFGVTSIILADTTGMATPNRVKNMARCFDREFSNKILTFHFHNNRGTAMVNLFAAMDAGVFSFDTAIGGIGGCPYAPIISGNLPTEDVVYVLEEMNINTGIDLDSVIYAAKLLENVLGYKLPGQVMKSGPRISFNKN